MRCVNGTTSRVDTGCGMSTEQQAEWTQDAVCQRSNKQSGHRMRCVNGATSKVDTGCGVSTEQQAEWTQDAVCQRSNKQSGHRMRCVNGATSRVDTGCGVSAGVPIHNGFTPGVSTERFLLMCTI